MSTYRDTLSLEATAAPCRAPMSRRRSSWPSSVERGDAARRARRRPV